MVPPERKILRCAIYTRKSSEHGLEQDFNSLHAQREAAEAYIKSQANEGWKLVRTQYNDGGLSGGTIERPALQALLGHIDAGLIDVVVVYKVDRLTRSLSDFAKLVELFEARSVSFVSVTQQFNTTTSMGRLTLNVLLSFAQFEREVSGERIRDKFAASRRKGMWMGGNVPLGYDVKDRKLIINETEAKTVRLIFTRYFDLGCVKQLRIELNRLGIRSKKRRTEAGRTIGGAYFSRGALYHLLRSRVYRGEAVHKGIAHPGEHAAIIDDDLWEAVQAKLTGNATEQRRGRAEGGALLMGLLYDDRGNRMSPSHTTRKNGRYRYYVSQAILQYQKENAGSRSRIGAEEIESLIVTTLKSELPHEEVRQEAASGSWAPETRNLIQSSVSKIVLHASEAEIILQKRPASETIPIVASEDSEGPWAVRVPLPEPKKPDRKKILLPSNSGAPPQPLDRSLIVAVARGRSWVKALRRGEYANTKEIAARIDLSEPYVRRILRLAFLAPDIVEALADGRQPRALTLERLLSPLPLSWAEQRLSLGFSR